MAPDGPPSTRCPRCGLPTSPIDRIHGSTALGPMALPGVKRVEVCACPSEDDTLAEQIAAGDLENDRVRRALESLDDGD